VLWREKAQIRSQKTIKKGRQLFMSYLKTKSPENAVFEGFSGIDTRFFHSKAPRTSDICNFRICDNGSLKKRCGFRHSVKLNEEIRAVWTGMLNGEEKCLLLHGNKVSLYDKESNSVSTLGIVETSSGRACFFYYRDRLYIADGNKIYELVTKNLRLSTSIGYIPLIGKDWPTGKRGEIYEKRNLLCNFARISYKIESYPTIYLHTGWSAKNIDAVYLNGDLLPSSDYVYNATFKSVELEGLSENDEVLIYVTYEAPEDEEISQGFFSCVAATNFGDLDGDRIFMWGGSKKNTLYCSEFVSRESMEGSQKASIKSSSLYFPSGYEFAAGDGRHDVRAAIRHYDRLLVFTDGDAWNADPKANGLENIPLLSINQGAGCSSMCAVETADNSPVSIGKHTIFSWNTDTDEYNECNAASISTPVDPLLSEYFYKNATVFNAKKYGELWFHAFGEENTWIYNIKSKKWYRFTGFDAKGFFRSQGEIFFFDSYNIYRFDDSLNYDILNDSSTVNINAIFSSDILEFSTSDKKRLDHLLMRADTNGGILDVQFSFDCIHDIYYNFKESLSDRSHSVFTKRLHSGRFKYAVLKLYSSDSCIPTVHSIEIGVR
jgi:hypothetical protein